VGYQPIARKLVHAGNRQIADRPDGAGVDVQRFRIIAVAVVLAAIGAIAPIVMMLHVSWTLAVKAEHDRLDGFASQTITRANRVYAETRDALHAIHGSDAEPCSTPHIERMRVLTIDTPSVHEIGYFEDRLLKCTSWGPTETRIEQTPSDYTTADGLGVTINMQPLVSHGKPMTAIQYKDYNALVDRMRFVDVIVDPGIRLAIASEDGDLIATLNDPDPHLLKSIIAEPRNGMDQHNLFSVARGDGWMAIATQSRGEMLSNLRREQMLLLPIGAFIAVFIVGIVVWLSRKRLSPLGELTFAVQKREFIAYYQPIVELKTGRCVGAEALVRWRRPDGTIVQPDLFVPLAEQSGLIRAITDQVIEAVVADLGDLLVAERSLHVAINLSADDVKTGRVLPVLQNALARSDVWPQQIWLEATERGFVDIASARTTIARARQLGYSVAIDDFGTGYSSLQYLQGLPLDALKIDKSFIDTIGRNTATSSVTSHIIDMAKALNLYLIAEGVETEAQAAYLRARNVDFAQGWLLGKAQPAEQFKAFYLQNKRSRAVVPLATGRAIA
jgi:sensor c-di-GMP phosphodiesterase-like protein